MKWRNFRKIFEIFQTFKPLRIKVLIHLLKNIPQYFTTTLRAKYILKFFYSKSYYDAFILH